MVIFHSYVSLPEGINMQPSLCSLLPPFTRQRRPLFLLRTSRVSSEVLAVPSQPCLGSERQAGWGLSPEKWSTKQARVKKMCKIAVLMGACEVKKHIFIFLFKVPIDQILQVYLHLLLSSIICYSSLI
jgi:hypothetical protein